MSSLTFSPFLYSSICLSKRSSILAMICESRSLPKERDRHAFRTEATRTTDTVEIGVSGLGKRVAVVGTRVLR